MKNSFFWLVKLMKTGFQVLYKYGIYFISQLIKFFYKMLKVFKKGFTEKFKENIFYDILKYTILGFLIIVYTNKGFIEEVYQGEQSVYCHICYHLEIEQEYLRAEIKSYLNNMPFAKRSWSKHEQGGFMSLGFISEPSKDLEIRSKLYDSLREHNEVSLAMKHSNCDGISEKYNKYSKYKKNPGDVNSLCKFRGMSFFDKIIYHIRKII